MTENRFYSGSTIQDLIVGGEKDVCGYEPGKVYNIVGDKSAGKTFLAHEIIAVNKIIYGEKLKHNYDDCELGSTLDSKKLYGFSIIDKNTVRSSTVEDLFVNIRNFISKLKKDEMGIYVVDSLDAIGSEQDKERAEKRIKLAKKGKSLEKGSYNMAKQKYLSQEFFRNLVKELENTNCMLLIISQVRENIGVMFGEKYTRSGGKALDFFAHSCIWLAACEKIKKENRNIGVRIKIKTKKSKTPRPYREGYLVLWFDYGVDDLGSNIDYLFELITPTGKAKGTEANPPKLEYEGKQYIKDTLIKYIEDNDLEDSIKQEVIDDWESKEEKIKTVRKSKF